MLEKVINWAMGYDQPIAPWVTDATESQITTLNQEAEELDAKAGRVELLTAAVVKKAGAIRRLVNANAAMEKATIELAIDMEQTNKQLIPLRKKFKHEVDRNLQNAALRVRQQSNNFYEIFKP